MNKSQGHGDHIGTIMEPQEYIQNYIQDALQKSSIGEKADILLPFDNTPRAMRRVVSLNYGEPPLQMRSIIIAVPEQNQNAFASAFPVLESNHTVELTIENVEEWSGEYEASVTACTVSGFSLHFFPTDYFAHKQDYVVGNKLRIALSAFAYSAQESERGFSFEGQQALDFLSKIGQQPTRDTDGNIEPVRFDMSKMVAYLPTEEYPEDAQFQSPVSNVEDVRFLDRDFYLCDILVHRADMDDDIDVTARLCIRKDLLNSIELTPATPILGMYWLQGNLVK